jgi:glycosyltransferase involved in cell wall biosynthesis
MKVLQLCNKPPYPSVDGGTMAMNSITKGLLSMECKVKVLTVETDKHPARRERMTEEYLQQTGFESVYVDLGLKPLPAMGAMLCGESYHVKRYVSNDFAAKLREILENEQFDIVHVESIFLTPYVPLVRKLSDAKVILRAHNVEHLIWKRVAQSCSNPFKRWYLKHLSLALRAYELEHINDYDGIVCITPNDAEVFRQNGCRKPVTSIPFGVDTGEDPGVDVEPNSLFHIGAMDWLPNQEGVRWLLEEVWPVVHREVPEAKLYLAGRKMPARWMNAAIEGVSVVGEVPDALYFIGSKKINVVPLLSGSGIRVKIIEAMSIGKTVVTTTVGAQGIDYTDGENLLIADTPEQFAQQIKRCLEDTEFCDRVGDAAARLVADRYNEQKLAKQLFDFYNKRLDR